MPRPIRAFIHQNALKSNLQTIRKHAPNARVWAVVKANAYGHGIERVFNSLRDADGFALLDLKEAQCLRELGWRGPILLLEGAFEARDLELCSRLKLTHTVHCDAQIDWLAAHKTQHAHHVFLKLNAGMNRLGFSPALYRSAWARLSALPQVGEISIMAHFSDADNPTGITQQHKRFIQATQDLAGERSLCNSAASLHFGRESAVSQDWIRAGIALYGAAPDYPSGSAASWQLQPSMSLRSQIIATQDLCIGDSVGYGSRFIAEQPMRIGIVACGYADGYPRICKTGTPILVDGKRTRTLGCVSMDMLAADISHLPNAKIGSEVVLWGQSSTIYGSTLLPIEEVAVCANTIGYELMCALALRVPVEIEEL